MSDAYLEQLEKAKVGESLENLSVNHDFAAFRDNILNVISDNAYEIFKSAPADDKIVIIGAQQMGKVVDSINDRMEALIQEGKLIRSNLKDSNLDSGGEA